MFIEYLNFNNFRCFGDPCIRIDLEPGMTAFIGTNGAGKTAALQGILRLFGVTNEQRRIQKEDFHIPSDETTSPQERHLSIEAILAFPELAEGTDTSVIPAFFDQMLAEENGKLKCRFRLEATWIDDGSIDGAIEQSFSAINKFGEFEDSNRFDIKSNDRSRIQMIYVSAKRDAISQVTSFLRSRFWRAINWSDHIREAFNIQGTQLNEVFSAETGIHTITTAIEKRWKEVHKGATDTKVALRPLNAQFHDFVRKVEVAFQPNESGGDRSLDALSDGQKSLFHLAMTTAILDIEATINKPDSPGFLSGSISIPALTLIAIEEPENNLAPFYLSRIIDQIKGITKSRPAQAFVSSHSPSTLSRIDPTEIRYFRILPENRTTQVKKITLPEKESDTGKFVREAVRAYPELYFARFVVLTEGASEEIVLPRLAEAMNLPIDKSFVAVVPIGGRHVNHFWKLLHDLDIPHATLLDLDFGRYGGGWGRIKYVCSALIQNGIPANQIFIDPNPDINVTLNAFDTLASDLNKILKWVAYLKKFNVFFSNPLDLDYSMLKAFPNSYKVIEPDKNGPGQANPMSSVLGENGTPALYPDNIEDFRWYRYLFLGRSKPSSHLAALSSIDEVTLRTKMPEELQTLLNTICKIIGE